MHDSEENIIASLVFQFRAELIRNKIYPIHHLLSKLFEQSENIPKYLMPVQK